MTPEERVRVRVRVTLGYDPPLAGVECLAAGTWEIVATENDDDAEVIARAIRQAIAEAVAEERERCAKISDDEADGFNGRNADRYWQSRRIAGMIRQTGTTPCPNE